ncbi:hypothetical protein BGZ59_000629 [Podila verticillata]|nr:hypothetical protein BGZ59_000629 [Podila verticillata]KFH63899.1 hypothetical protein MVEG_10592 [Podila verticillata NRRL 6337]
MSDNSTRPQDYNLSLHIGALFANMGASALGARTFGSGVILATAFIHMLPTAFANLTDDRLPSLFQEAGYTGWPGLIAMLAAMLLHLFEFVATQRLFLRRVPHRRWRLRPFLAKGPTAVGPTGGTGTTSVEASSICPVPIEKIQELYGTLYSYDHDVLEDERRNPYFKFHQSNDYMDGFHHRSADGRPMHLGHSHGDDIVLVNKTTRQATLEAQAHKDVGRTLPSGPRSPLSPELNAEALREHERRSQILNTYILEFGIALHSVIIGISLGSTTGPDFVGLLVALLFHQFFEGIALGGRIATLEFHLRSLKPWLLSAWFACSTPLGVAIGIAIRFSYDDESVKALITQGVFDACSAGILLYTALVQLMSAEMTNNQGFRKTSVGNQICHFVALWCGAAVMAVLGKWA